MPITTPLRLKNRRKAYRAEARYGKDLPTIVLKDTDLAALYSDGIYKPQTLFEAVNLAARLYKLLCNSGINGL